MASPKGMDGTPGVSDETFPVADVQGELHPAQNKDFQVDPVSSDVATSLEYKGRGDKKEKDREKKDALQTLKSAIIVSGAILAAAGAVFVITKKLKEK
ncbi:hypothetical protein CK203_073482 [Vitis vinifera]|uniref:Uncharacterized protein n=1 Tax=Vitis vinifera TaxID=29760 RepID=A0A438EKD6_VITVI|nr:hypothetical protein CK203_073482 [Vitis vinifera]